MTSPSITAAVIVLDEEQNLGRLLERLQWVDEIVVVDGGSTDATLDVARRHGCRCLVRPLDSFAGQRNFALEHARGQWVLSIDADERPGPALAAEIRRVAARGPCAAYRLPIRSRIFGRPLRRCGTQDDRPIRLFRRGTAQWVGLVHERLEVQGRVGRLQHWLQHETLPDWAAFAAKVERYTSLEARSRLDAGRAPAWHDAVWAPPREVLRRMVWKQGFLDGPAGWRFCLLSGWSEWVLACKHRRLWKDRSHPERSEGSRPAPAPDSSLRSE